MTGSLEGVWKHREEVVYPSLFGPTPDAIATLDHDVFMNVFQQKEVDPKWLFYGVFEYEPTAERGSWVYVTSGPSNPWDLEPDEYADAEFSGLGTELTFETTRQAPWAVVLLQRVLAFNVLLAAGRFGEDAELLEYGDRIPINAPLTRDEPTELEHLVIGLPKNFPATFRLPSGQVDFLHLVGITTKERDFAKENGSEALIEMLAGEGAYPVTDPARTSVIS